MDHTLRELQLCELELVKAVLSICETHHLTVFMMGGTFLGAVRHQGFIPWDDDVDLGMSRSDYETFLQVAPQELPQGYVLRHFAADPDMPYYPAQVVDPSFEILDTSAQISKTRSAWIDLFPLDGMPKSKVGCFFHKYRLLYLRMMLKFSQFSQVVAVNLAHRPLHERILIAAGKHLHLESRLNTQKRMALIDKSLKKYPYEGARQVVNFMGAYKFREMFPKSIYDSLAEYPFETLSLSAPADYDTVLRQMYGDYMTPPPKDEQNKHRYRKGHAMKRVITYGTFDLLHYGHINLLRRAKALGDYLIVALSTDEFNLKEKNKVCYFSYEERKKLLEAIRYVDLVIPEENWDQKRTDIPLYHVDTFVMGDDWKGKFDFLEDLCQVVYLPRTPEISTTKIKKELGRE